MSEGSEFRKNIFPAPLPERVFGLDLLRILAMVMIVLLHVSGHGGIPDRLRTDYPLTLSYYLTTAMHYFANTGVDIFILLSGYIYIYIGRKYKFTNLIHIFLITMFYTVLFFFVQYFFYQNHYGFSFLKTNVSGYWFINLYAGLFCLIPFLNKILNDAKWAAALLSVGFLLFSVIPLLTQQDCLYTAGGFSLQWFVFLYLLGGLCGKYHLERHVPSRLLLWICIGAFLISFGTKLIFENIFFLILGKYRIAGNYFFPYNSPTNVVMALCLLLLFAKMDRGPEFLRKICFRLSPLMLGIYLCHDSVFFRTEFILGKFAGYPEKPVMVFAGKFIGTAGIIFLSCLILEYLRSLLFRFAGEKKILEMMNEKIISGFCAYIQNRWETIEKYFENTKK